MSLAALFLRLSLPLLEMFLEQGGLATWSIQPPPVLGNRARTRRIEQCKAADPSVPVDE
jgi:hypothetical protein